MLMVVPSDEIRLIMSCILETTFMNTPRESVHLHHRFADSRRLWCTSGT
jgi:hypothetical protein